MLEEPDTELRVVILETGETNLREAIEQGMRTLDPRFARKVERTRRPPPTHGWDEALEVEYEAAEHLEYELRTRRDDADRARREIRAEVDPAWARELTGTYEHPGLGRLTVSARGSAVTIRAGERTWRAGQKVESDGTRKLVLLDPPLAGLGIVPRREAVGISLLIDTPQEKYLLSPVSPAMK